MGESAPAALAQKCPLPAPTGDTPRVCPSANHGPLIALHRPAVVMFFVLVCLHFFSSQGRNRKPSLQEFRLKTGGYTRVLLATCPLQSVEVLGIAKLSDSNALVLHSFD